ncbi:MAG: hypothetical protein ACLTYW_03890 [Collinsella sp.]
MSAADLPRVFEKGFTGDNGRTTKRATGIGLYGGAPMLQNGHRRHRSLRPRQKIHRNLCLLNEQVPILRVAVAWRNRRNLLV